MRHYKCTPIKDSEGRIDIDITEIYNVEDEEERYPSAFNQWRIGELIKESDILISEGVAYNRKLMYL